MHRHNQITPPLCRTADILLATSLVMPSSARRKGEPLPNKIQRNSLNFYCRGKKQFPYGIFLEDGTFAARRKKLDSLVGTSGFFYARFLLRKQHDKTKADLSKRRNAKPAGKA
jgi:hypothetical protein